MLGCRVGGMACEACLGHDGCHIDDGTTTIGHHGRQLPSHGKEYTGQVDVNDPLPILYRAVPYICRLTTYTGAIPGNVQTAVMTECGSDQ
ncbi:hypothetical protein D3C78_1620240 [compost metagenome]